MVPLLIWCGCGLGGVIVLCFRSPRKMARGGVVDLMLRLAAGVFLGGLSLYSALTNRDIDF